MGQGIDAARAAGAGLHADVMENFRDQLIIVIKGCGVRTTMGRAIAETYARKPSFYGSTYCCGCSTHRPVGKDGEFVWDGTQERVGT